LSCPIALLLAGVVPPLAAQTLTADTLRGRVTTDSGVTISGAEVVATRSPDRAFKTTLTDSGGYYQIVFESGTGDYLLHVSALGYTTVRLRIRRAGNAALLTQNFQLESSIHELETVTVSAEKAQPTRETSPTIEPGEAGKLTDGLNGAVPPDVKGNLAAIASTVPGISLTSAGISVLGLAPSQNQTTLNGMAFAGTEVPRAARVSTKVSSSSYDPARGWFSGAEITTDLSPGFLFTETNLAFVIDAPALQYADRISTESGQKFTNIIGSLANAGTFARDKFNYRFALEGGHHSSPYTSLEGASAELLQRSGVSRDSANRLLTLLSAAGIPITGATSTIRHNSDYLEFLGRVDRAGYNYPSSVPEKQTWGLLGYARVGRTSAVGVGPNAVAMHGGETSQALASAQAVYSTYLHDRDYLTDAKTAISVKVDRSTPYIRTPSGIVLVTSDFPNGPSAVEPISFGLNSSLDQEIREWTWETTGTTSFYVSNRARHRVQFTADSRIDGLEQASAGNSHGTFSYSSLADLAANAPSAFTRTLTAPQSSLSEWNAFASIGDYWRRSKTFQLLYGVRIEGNRFLDRPRYNPELNRLFGVRSDEAPDGFRASPRVGFTWVRIPADDGISYNGMGEFHVGPPSYLRGGVGEFRNMLPPSLLSQAIVSNGLPAGITYLTCIGLAVPPPDWKSYELNPATVPTQCEAANDVVTHFADASPSVSLFDPSYQPPKSWRGNLSYASTVHSLLYSIEGIYSINLNQPGRINLNFSGVPYFLTNEGRPVYVGTSSIDPSSGIASTVDARKMPSFGPVIMNRADLRSISKQATLIVSPPPELTRHWFGSIAYTLSSLRGLASGFDASTFESPSRREWARGDLDARHQLLLQGGMLAKGAAITVFAHVRSGLPFTPLVGADVNGDGLSNDRAYIFNPATTSDSALGTGLRELIAGSPRSIRNCLIRQYGTAAARNSCEEPWTVSVDMQVTKGFKIPNSNGRSANVAIHVFNPLGGVDQLLHGSEHLRGWGSQTFPDPILYSVRGFDSLSHHFRYEVNQRFGNVRAVNSIARTPFRLELEVSLNVGPPLSLQQLVRSMGPGRNRPGPTLTAIQLKSRYRRMVPDPYSAILEESDSLLLSLEQEKALETVQADYLRSVDSLWTPFTDYLAALENSFDSDEALRRQEDTIDAVWEYTRLHIQKTLGLILTPVQMTLLPWEAALLYNAKKPLRLRIYTG
jgi:hypothetical protein